MQNDKGKNMPKKKPKVKIYTKTKKKNDPESVVIEKLKEKYTNIDISNVETFNDLPLSKKTLQGLKDCHYIKPTKIQKETIGLSLQGKDILGAAKTGSGKTLAFIIPILEILFCEQWTTLDGLGALVITPTRELAYQIYETLLKVGVHHDFSAGLIIGGKDLKFERKRVNQCNIIICTPGRLLQHMDENPLFDCVNLKILVLDEADRCLDMGFKKTMNAIIENLPAIRQTLLFSATQTKSVQDLIRLSLKDPSYVAVHEHSKYSTPGALEQSYSVCNIKDKVSIIWSFIRNHSKKKTIVFFSTSKQAKYMFEIFTKLRPGVTLFALYGRLHQLRRMNIYDSFCQKTSAVLFATDLAARGLDFPNVHWVVQADCPEDAATYIHRAGRTARYENGGNSLLLLLPSEIGMLEELEKQKIPIEQIDINPMKLHNPVKKMEVYLSKDEALDATARRAFVTYIKSVHLMKNKNIFKLRELDFDSYSSSLGLSVTPKVRFLERLNKKKQPKAENGTASKEGSNDDESDDDIKQQTKEFQLPDDDDNDYLVSTKTRKPAKKVLLPGDLELPPAEIKRNPKKPITKAAAVKMALKKKEKLNKKIVFDDEGEPLDKNALDRDSNAQKYELDEPKREQFEILLKEADKIDKEKFKERIKAERKEAKRKLKQKDEDEVRDEFGSDSEDEPDLSWLPDPDKVYGEKEAENDEDVTTENESEDEKQDPVSDSDESYEYTAKTTYPVVRSQKRKNTPDVAPNFNVKKKKFERVSKNLSVNEAEELAMLLLQQK